MKKNYIIAFASLALALVGCSKNEITDPQPTGVTVIEVSTPETKAVLGEDGLTVNWQLGDKIKVNGVDSEGLTAEDITSPASARFTFNGTLEAPYYGMYNAVRGHDFVTSGTPHCSVNLDTPQTYAEGSFDAKAAVFYGKSETANAFPLQHAMAYLKVTPAAGTAADAKIAYVMLSSRSGAESLSGRFQLSFENGGMTPVAGNDYVVMQGPADGVVLGEPFIIAIPVQEYSSGLRVRIVSVDGKYMDRNLKAFTAVAGKLYPVATAFNPTGDVPATATAAEVTSSTACVGWTLGKGANTDKAKPWTVQCSASFDFAGAKEYTIPANNAAWDGRTPKFCFGGLAQNTTYYFRVKTGTGAWSDVVSSKTLTYDKTVVSANAKVGDVILAEDFAELAIHGERVANAAGVNESGNGFIATWSSYTITNADKNELPTRAASLKDWGFSRGTGSGNLYANQGYFKLGTGSAQSYLVSPELNAIPEGKKAKLEVEVTLAAYPDDKANVTKFFVLSAAGTMSATNMFTPGLKTSNKVEGNLAADAAERIKWVTYTVSVENVLPGERLMVGAANNAGNNRIQVSDVKAKILTLEDAEPAPVPSPIAAATEVSSSSVSFTWGYEGVSATDNVNRQYEFGLYSDEDCEDLLVSYKSAAGHGCWESRKPKFCFGGLQSNTTYYFKVKDVEADVESEVVSSKTSAFTNVTMPATAAASGDIILAEDFSELILGGEYVIKAASACTKKADTEIFKTLSGGFPTCYLAASGEEVGMTGGNYDAAKAGKRIANWSYAFNSGSSVYSHVGMIKLGTGSNNTWLTTPVLSAIPAGMTADLEITVTLASYSGGSSTGFVYAGNISDQASITTAQNVIKSSSMAISDGQWKTFTVTLSGVDNTMRLAIGPDSDTAVTAKGKGRMCVNDIVVKITSLK